MRKNPFTPSFGVAPPLLVGRTDLIEDFGIALDEGPGAPGRATIYTGARGVGKTVMLNEAEEQARSRGWLVISETATPGLISRLTLNHLPQLIDAHVRTPTKRRLTGIKLNGLVGVNWETTDASTLQPALRQQISELTDALAEHETGLLITVDEIHRYLTDELRELGTIVQHMFREGRELAFAAAGLPSSINDLLNDDVLTFLRRADRHALGAVQLGHVAEAIRNPIERTGRSISDDACSAAADATSGYPFLIQLVGYHIWRQSPTTTAISDDDVATGIAAARRRVGSLVLEPSLADISDVDRSFLVAMSHDDGPSKTSEIAQRLGVSTTYAGQYRLRLISADLITPAGFGKLTFTMPYLREYLRGHAAAMGLPQQGPKELS
ncbi:MAG: ATP-binding protein [Rhodococcus sp.]|nr:ATP-binding protein [Rhodococcus sp. (in: high G+C Gram-positive bacteria)]